MTAALLGVLLGLGIGAACRWFDIPSPAPPRLVGALLVVSMTLGFLVTDVVLAQRAASGESLVASKPTELEIRDAGDSKE